MDKLLTAENCKNFKELRKGYHDRLFDAEGCPFLSSTTVKSLFNKSWSKDTAATLIGERVHEMLNDMANGIDFNVVSAINRKNSKAYAAEVELLEAEAKRANKKLILCNKTDFASLSPSYHVGQKFLASIKHTKKYPEAMAFVSAKEVAAVKASSLSPEFAELHEWIVKSKCGVKCAPDLLVQQLAAKQLQIYDYKRSAKRSLNEIYGQIHYLNYSFSMFYYRYVLELIGIKTNPKCILLILTDLDVPMRIEIDTADQAIYHSYVAPILTKDYADYYETRHQIMSGTHTYKFTAPSLEQIKQIEESETDEQTEEFLA